MSGGMFSELKKLDNENKAVDQAIEVKHQKDLSPTPLPVTKTIEKKPQTEAKSQNHDVMTSSRQDVNLRKWRDIIEDTEVHNSALRLTNEERYDLEDLVSELRRKYKIKTSMNEIARLGLLYIVDDFKKDKHNALIIKVKKS
jgi:hypothetical protein